MNKPHPHDIEMCPNPNCKALSWHGLPVGHEKGGEYLWSQPYCPGSHLFNEDGTLKESNG